MRFAIILAFGIFLWAGTISIKYPQTPSTVTASAKKPVQENLMVNTY